MVLADQTVPAVSENLLSMQIEFLATRARSLRLLATGLVIPALLACSGSNDNGTPEDPVDQPSSADRNDEFYAELAQSFEPFVPDPSIGAAQNPEDFIVQGRWSEVVDWPEIATGAANLPDGRLMTWASTSATNFGGVADFTQGSIYDPETGTFTDKNNNYHNNFCAGLSMLPDGRTIAAGGGDTITTTSIFDLATNEWELTDAMNFPRWYSTTTTLPSGQAITALGTREQPFSEIWTDGVGWDVRTNLSLQNVLNDNSAPTSQRDWYPALNVAPDGSLFHAGPTSELFSLFVGEDEGLVSHGKRENGDPFRLYNTTVMYDVGKMLIAGGGKPALASALTVDLNGAAPQIAATNAMNHARSMQNSIVLPDGKVMVVGGNSSGIQFSDEGTQLTPELWDPDTGVWQELAQHSVPRNYHSTGLLLKDGRVASLGGGLCGGCPTNHQNGQFYEPPYLFNADGTPATRPAINSGEAIASVSDVINLQGSTDLVKFNMVRLVALTHHHTTDQRLVPLAIQGANNGSYQLAIPSNPNVVIPGYYWIFGFNGAGVPTVGHTIKINVGTDLNTTTITGTGVVEFEYYEGTWFGLPDFDSLTPISTGNIDGFNLSPAQRSDEFAIRFKSKIIVPEDGLYTFYTTSDDGSELFIDGQLVVDNNGIHTVTEQSGTLSLTAGLHDIEVGYLEYQGSQSLIVSWEGPGFPKKDISSDLTIGLAELPTTSPTSESGINYEYYEGTWNSLPDFDTLPPVSTGNIDSFSLQPALRDDFFAFRYVAKIEVPQDGNYSFYTASDDGTQLFINGQMVLDNDGLHPVVEQTGTISLDAGQHDIELHYFEKTGDQALQVSWSGPGFSRQQITNAIVGNEPADPPAPTPDPVAPTTDTPSPTERIAYEYYEGSWDALPDFSLLTPVSNGTLDSFSLEPALAEDFFAMRFLAQIQVPTDGDYTFYAASDDGSQITIDDQLVVDNDGLHASLEKQGTIDLTAGAHDIVVTVFEKTGLQSLEVSWSGPGLTRAPLASAVNATPATPVDPVTPDPADLVTAGIHYDYYEGTWDALPDFSSLEAVESGNLDNFSIEPAQRGEFFAFRYTANLQIPEDGDYTFSIASDDGSQLFINGQLIVDNDGLHANIEKAGTTTLTAGSHEIVVTMFERTGQQSLTVQWEGPGFARTEITDVHVGATTLTSALDP